MTDTTIREAGYYWIRLHGGEPQIAEFYLGETWHAFGCAGEIAESDVEVLSLRLLVPGETDEALVALSYSVAKTATETCFNALSEHGFVIVPREPEAMLCAAAETGAHENAAFIIDVDSYREPWRAMLASAPDLAMSDLYAPNIAPDPEAARFVEQEIGREPGAVTAADIRAALARSGAVFTRSSASSATLAGLRMNSEAIREAVARALAAADGVSARFFDNSLAHGSWSAYLNSADAAIAAHLKAIEEAGYVVVPREATPEMDVAGRFKCHGVDIGDGSMRRACGGFLGETATEQWRRMIAAAPKAT